MLFAEYILQEERIKHRLINIIDELDKNAFKRWHAIGFVDMEDGLKFIVKTNKYHGYVYLKNSDILLGKKIASTFKIVKHFKNVMERDIINIIDKNI
jgi:hypothetical protein